MHMVIEDQERLQNISKYCLRDAKVVYDAIQKIYRKEYTSVQGFSMTKEFAPQSAASHSFHIFKRCFLKFNLHGTHDKQLLAIERMSYIGGSTQVYKNRMETGVCVDIKSSYPSAMQNLMPIKFKRADRPVVDCFADVRNPIYINNKSAENASKLMPAVLYRVRFDFIISERCAFPSLTIKVHEHEMEDDPNALVAPEDKDYHILTPASSAGRFYWIWGVELIEAVRAYGADFHFHVSHYIEYVCEFSHREFIQYFAQKRMRAQAKIKVLKGSTAEHLQQLVGSKFLQKIAQIDESTRANLINKYDIEQFLCKNKMNSCYGKHSQKDFPQTAIQEQHVIDDLEQEILANPLVRPDTIVKHEVGN